MLLFGLSGKVGPLLFGLLLLGGGGANIWSWKNGRPTDKQMDAFISEDLVHAKVKSLQSTSTDHSELVGESVVITGPRFYNTGGAQVMYRKGDDNILRYSPINVTVLDMTQNQLMAYQSALDLTTGKYLSESTDEYFYKDVVSVSTKAESQTMTLPIKGQNVTHQFNAALTFVLTTSGGTSIKTVLRDDELITKMGGGDMPTTEAERAIQVVRKMLREKKGA